MQIMTDASAVYMYSQRERERERERDYIQIMTHASAVYMYSHTHIYLCLHTQIMTDGSAGARETVDMENLYKPTSDAISALTRPSVTLPLPGVGEPGRERERERERGRVRECARR